jgi:hypothetical protein
VDSLFVREGDAYVPLDHTGAGWVCIGIDANPALFFLGFDHLHGQAREACRR